MKRTALLGSPRRLQKVLRTCWFVIGLGGFAALMGIHQPALVVAALVACVVGIAAIARAWWIEFKQ